MPIVNNLYYPAFLGECSKHKRHGWLGCPLCAIEDVERRRKELKEMLNENDFDIDSFIDYKPNFKNMQKKIKFDASLIGKEGIEVRVDGKVPFAIGYFKEMNYPISVIRHDGEHIGYTHSSPALTMYRAIRSAEEIAKDVWESSHTYTKMTWETLISETKNFYTALVQAGMDEVTNINE